ncbi:MAG: phosphatidate cytidylyltransferase [bacterium]
MGTLKRVLSGVVFVPILVLISRYGGGWFLALVDMILIVGLWEFYRLMEAKGLNPSKKVGVAATLVLSTLAYWYGPGQMGHWLALFLTCSVVVITIRELMREQPEFPAYDIATTAFGVIYVGWMLVHLVLLRELPRELGLPYSAGSAFLLYAFLMVWACDTGAYFVGLTFGRHRLLERVSPKKSVEGAIGGFASAVLAALWGRAWFVRDEFGLPYLAVGEAVVLGVLVGTLGQLGDLVESLLKRDARIKDSSDTIPGHGGILDRFDSLMFGAPVTYYFLRLVVFR